MSATRKVVVVGAGAAGLACALAATSAGHRVDVYETHSQPVATPAAIQVVPSMMRGLVALGIADECVRAGFPYDGIDMVDRRGRILTREHTPSLAGLHYPPSMGIALDDLVRILEGAALHHGAHLHRASTVVVDHVSGKLSLSGDPQGLLQADLVIVATGADSKLCQDLFPSTLETTRYPQSWWSAKVRRDPVLMRPRYATGPERRKSLVIPLSGQFAGLTYIHTDSRPPQGENVPAYFAHALSGFPALERGLAVQLDGLSTVEVRPVVSAILGRPWSESGAIAVGDCACTLPPQLGQGTAQAIDDAIVLGELLTQDLRPDTLAKTFGARRLARRKDVYEITTRAARWEVAPERDTDFQQLSRDLSKLVATSA